MFQSFGFLTQHMTVHLALMGVVAPLVAARVPGYGTSFALRPHLTAATMAQIGLLWAWHAPFVLTSVHGSAIATLAMHLSLFGCSVWFWAAIFGQAGRAPWKSILALLVTGKLLCLLGILFTFAPRPIYAITSLHAGHSSATGDLAIADQQLAGLVMLATCPVVYVAAATLIVRRWLSRVDRSGGWSLTVRRQA